MVIANIGRVGRLGLTRSTGVPWWAGSAHVVDGVRPGFFLDVLSGRYAIGGASRSLADLLTVTNASAIRTYIDQSGVMQTASANTPRLDWASGVRELLLEGASTNLFLNSATLSTQSITTTATAYVLSFWGTGTVTMSGAYSGSLVGTGANTRVAKTFTAAAGIITFTVTGSVTNAQFEAGSGATSYILTTSTAVTRTADLCQLSAAAAAVLQGAGAAMVFRGGAPVIPSTSQPLIGGPTTSRLLYLPSSGSGIPYMDNSIGHALGVTETSPLDIRAAFGWGGSGQRGASWGGPARADARILGAAVSSLWLGGNSGLLSGQIIRVRQIVGWSLPDRPSAAGVQAQARAAS